MMGERLWRGAYNRAGVPLIWLGFRVGSLFDEKTREAVALRRGWEDSLRRQLLAADRAEVPSLWFHAASVGEFEQAKPLMEALHPTYRIVATCFSPSVADAMTRYPYQDASICLPIDSRRNAERLFDLVRPRALIFSKFDVWPNCVWRAAARGVPVALIAGTMHASSKRLRPIGRDFLRHVHKYLTLQCAVSEEDAERLRRVSPPGARIIVTGDTRFDQVAARAERAPEAPLLPVEEWPGFRIVAGSTYDEDERVLIPAFVRLREHVPDARMALVPHEPTDAHLDASEAAITKAGLRCVRFSAVEGGRPLGAADVLLVDRVGLLAHLYRFGTVAFVGGSFRARVHNVMEPAVLSKPVLFGPHMDNAGEAYGLMECGAARRLRTVAEMTDALLELAGDDRRVEEMGRAGRQYILSHLGAAERTLRALRDAIL